MMDLSLRRRKAAFKSALSFAGVTQQEWCATTGITPGHLWNVLQGTRQSDQLIAKVDAFIAEQARAMTSRGKAA
jgi:hypothetical protein